MEGDAWWCHLGSRNFLREDRRAWSGSQGSSDNATCPANYYINNTVEVRPVQDPNCKTFFLNPFHKGMPAYFYIPLHRKEPARTQCKPETPFPLAEVQALTRGFERDLHFLSSACTSCSFLMSTYPYVIFNIKNFIFKQCMINPRKAH